MPSSQKYALLEELHAGNWVTLPTLMDVRHRGRRIANISARISELRAEDFTIINSEVYNKVEKYFESCYMLVPDKKEDK